MVRGYGYDEQDLGFYVGILASSYFVAQVYQSILPIVISEFGYDNDIDVMYSCFRHFYGVD